MRNFLKNYEFTLTVKGPVHIGDGKTLTKVDYFFYKDRIYFPNLHKMFLYIKQMHLTSDYESFMYSARNDLTYWLNDKRIISAVAVKTLHLKYLIQLKKLIHLHFQIARIYNQLKFQTQLKPLATVLLKVVQNLRVLEFLIK